MKYLFLFPLFFSTIIYSQEQTFETTHMTISGIETLGGSTTMKVPVKFLLYKDSLIIEQIHKGTIRQLKKMGMPTKVSFESPLVENGTPSVGQYSYEMENQKYTVLMKPAPSVKHQIRDDFSGKVTEILYLTVN